MQNVTGNPATFHTVIRAIENGDTLNTANFLTAAQDIADNLAWLKAAVDEGVDHAWTGEHTFADDVTFGIGANIEFHATLEPVGSGAVYAHRVAHTADVASYSVGVDDGEFHFFNALSQAIDITLKKTSPIPPTGAVLYFFKRGGGNFNVNWKREGGASLATNFDDNTQDFGIGFVFHDGDWTPFMAWGGAVPA